MFNNEENMKISNISKENIFLSKNKFYSKQKETKSEILADNLTGLEKNPKYYKAYKDIYFGSSTGFLALISKNESNETSAIKVKIPLKNGETKCFTFGDKTTVQLLSKNGRVDNNALNIFCELFNDYFSVVSKKYKKEKRLLESVLSEDDKNTFLLFDAKQNCEDAFKAAFEARDKDYLEVLLKNIKDKRYKKELAGIYLEIIEEKYQQAAMTCALEALCIVRLSKNDDDIDMSNLDIKRDIGVYLTNFNQKAGNDYFDLVLENSKDENGVVNLNFMLKLVKILQSQKVSKNPSEQIKKIAAMLKK